MTGVAETGVGFMGVRCTRMAGGFHRNVCTARRFDGGDDRGSLAAGDWARDARKVQCIAGQIVKGVSGNPRGGTLRAILCCNISVM